MTCLLPHLILLYLDVFLIPVMILLFSINFEVKIGLKGRDIDMNCDNNRYVSYN